MPVSTPLRRFTPTLFEMPYAAMMLRFHFVDFMPSFLMSCCLLTLRYYAIADDDVTLLRFRHVMAIFSPAISMPCHFTTMIAAAADDACRRHAAS